MTDNWIEWGRGQQYPNYPREGFIKYHETFFGEGRVFYADLSEMDRMAWNTAAPSHVAKYCYITEKEYLEACIPNLRAIRDGKQREVNELDMRFKMAENRLRELK